MIQFSKEKTTLQNSTGPRKLAFRSAFRSAFLYTLPFIPIPVLCPTVQRTSLPVSHLPVLTQHLRLPLLSPNKTFVLAPFLSSLAKCRANVRLRLVWVCFRVQPFDLVSSAEKTFTTRAMQVRIALLLLLQRCRSVLLTKRFVPFTAGTRRSKCEAGTAGSFQKN